MPDKTYIFNLALILLGSNPILDADSDTSKKAVTLRTVYDGARDLALADHPWNFATKRATLAQVSEAPAFGFTYAYQPPTDCLRVLGVCQGSDSHPHYHHSDIDPDITYRMEGGLLLTNESTVKIKYISRIEIEGLFSPGFVLAFSYWLAGLAAYGTTGNPSLKNQIMQEYATVGLPKAKSLDAQEGTPETVEENRWIKSRS